MSRLTVLLRNELLYYKINCQLYESQTYEVCMRLCKIYEFDNFWAKRRTTWNENYFEYWKQFLDGFKTL